MGLRLGLGVHLSGVSLGVERLVEAGVVFRRVATRSGGHVSCRLALSTICHECEGWFVETNELSHTIRMEPNEQYYKQEED